MSIESLKQQARRHEQKEEWQKALDQYKKAISALAEDDQADIGLVNRVGDLYVRVGQLDNAVTHYEEAVDLYREAFLPNNAIAVCKKIIRNVPDRHQAYLKIGQIRAEQGFLSDARTNFLTYAERMQQAGDLDESFRALVEFCDLAPDDVGVRITVAEQMAASERTAEAIEQLVIAYSRLTQAGDADQAAEVEQKIQQLDPSVDVGAAAAATGLGGGDEDFGGFGEIDLGGPADDEPAAVAEVELAGDEFEITGADDAGSSLEEAAEEVVGLAGMGGLDEDEDSEEAVELPMMGFGDDDDSDEDVTELPMMGFGDDEDSEEAVELPMIGFGDDDADSDDVGLPTTALDEDTAEDEGVELATMDFELGDEDEAEELPMMDAGDDRDGFALADAGVEKPESVAEAAEAFQEAVEEAASEPAPVAETPAPPEPVEEKPADGGDYVDLGAMILGGGKPAEKSTRFKVAYQEPSGDEQADFAKMLSQFKEKVSENLDAGDVRAHYDLGTAYKEMGLLEEAISSFQKALRASAEHLPTYEQMGQTFLEMGQPDAAVRTLERALKSKATVEDEFVGIYYYLARAFEQLEEKESAVEYYDRVFALDINFADVTERLRELR